ncbi:hypothetical protein MMC16_005348 [Acarospora aff. strigata]|nr:hypothetical protein [Acarospora aff. strigata]
MRTKGAALGTATNWIFKQQGGSDYAHWDRDLELEVLHYLDRVERLGLLETAGGRLEDADRLYRENDISGSSETKIPSHQSDSGSTLRTTG